MGSRPYKYVVEHDEDLRRALEQLQQRVLAAGEFRGAARHPRSVAEALRWSDETGTQSILDILLVSPIIDCGHATPVSPQECRHYFGRERPTLDEVERSDAFWESFDRGQARVLGIEEAGVSKLLFVGYTYD
jgi:hypothetical protein